MPADCVSLPAHGQRFDLPSMCRNGMPSGSCSSTIRASQFARHFLIVCEFHQHMFPVHR